MKLMIEIRANLMNNYGDFVCNKRKLMKTKAIQNCLKTLIFHKSIFVGVKSNGYFPMSIRLCIKKSGDNRTHMGGEVKLFPRSSLSLNT